MDGLGGLRNPVESRPLSTRDRSFGLRTVERFKVSSCPYPLSPISPLWLCVEVALS